jgi:hypothetical protein
MRSLHLHLPHRAVPVERSPDALAESPAALRRALQVIAAGLLAEALFLAPVVLLVVIVLAARALL